MPDSWIPLLNQTGATYWRTTALASLQAGILLAIVFIADLLLRHRVRAALRYGLWMLVIIKLLLPPEFISPTSIAYWVVPRFTPSSVAPQETQWKVSFSELSTPTQTLPTVAFVPPRPRLASPAAGLGLWILGAMVLAAAMAVRQRRILRLVRSAKSAPPHLQNLLQATAHELGIQTVPALRCVADPLSPALCGFWRPVILLPAQLELSDAAWRTVFLHELTHLRRYDLWANSLQALVQIVWWWNPVVWWLNARIRQVRETAVDEAVMLATSHDASDYPATLVTLARYCLAQPKWSLGFLGMLANPSRLERRVRRLIEKPLPKSACLGWSGWLLLLILAAGSLPMGFKTRAETSKPTVPTVIPSGSSVQTADSKSFKLSARKLAADIERLNALKQLLSQGSHRTDAVPRDLESWILELTSSIKNNIVELPSAKTASIRKWTDRFKDWLTPSALDSWNQTQALAAKFDAENADSLVFDEQRKWIEGLNGLLAMLKHGDQMQTELAEQKDSSKDRDTKANMLEILRVQSTRSVNSVMDEIEIFSNDLSIIDDFRDSRISKGVEHSSRREQVLGEPEVRIGDEATLRVARRLVTNGDHPHLQTLLSQFDAMVRRRLLVALSYSPNQPELRRVSGAISILLSQIGQETKSLSSKQNTSPLADSQKEVSDHSTAPIDVSGPKILPTTETGLRTRLFRLDSQMVFRLLGQDTDASIPAGGDVVQVQLHQFLARNGVPFPKPESGKDLSPNQPAVFLNRINGSLFARATLPTLERLEKVIQNLSPALHQIQVEARFIEGDWNAIAALNISGLSTNALKPGHTLLTETETEALLVRLKAAPGFEILATPKVTTLSGRAAEISVIDHRTVVTGQTNTAAGTTAFLTNSVPCGPTLQVTAWHDTAQPGALKMSATARFVEFLGYLEAPTPTPLIRSNSVSADAHLWDGQTHLLQMSPITNRVQFVDQVPILSDVPIVGRLFRSSGSQLQVRQRLVLITPKLIDPTGQPLYDASRRPFDPATKP